MTSSTRVQARRLLLLLTNVVLLIPLTIYAYTAIYVRYMADDYCVLAVVQRSGIIGTTIDLYFGWSGRFVHALAVSTALSLGSQICALLIVMTLIIWWVALFGIFRVVVRSRQWGNTNAYAAMATSILLLAVLDSTFSLVQSVYWIAGIFLYTAPLVLTSLYIWLLVAWNAQRLQGLALIICFILPFVAAGFSELYGLVETVGLFAVFMILFRTSALRQLRLRLSIGLVGSLMALVITIVAPGNFVRLSTNVRPDLFRLLVGTVIGPAAVIWAALLYWILAPFVIIGLPILAGLAFETRPVHVPRNYFLTLPILSAALAALTFTLSFFTTSNPPPERAWIVPQFILFCGLGAWAYLLGLRTHPARRPRGIKPLFAFVSAIMMALIFFTSLDKALNVSEALRRYATDWDLQNSTMRVRANYPDSFAIVPMPLISGPVKLSEERTYWAYRCAAVYYDLPAIAYDPALTQYIESKSLGWPDFSPAPAKSPTRQK